MSRYLKAAIRVLAVLLAAALIGLSLFTFMQLVVHPLMGPPSRPRSEEGTRPPALSEGREGPERGEEGLPGRIRPRALLKLALHTVPFGVATATVIFIQWVFLKKPPKIPGGPGVRPG